MMNKQELLSEIESINNQLAYTIQTITVMNKGLKLSCSEINGDIHKQVELTMFRAEKLRYLAKENFK
jgi:hypothetical protein